MQREMFFLEHTNQLKVESILTKVDVPNSPNPVLGSRRAAMSFEDLQSFLTADEQRIVDHILRIDPTTLGFKGRLLGLEPVPADLVTISGQKIQKEGAEVVLPSVLVPKNVFKGYQRMRSSIQSDLGKDLLIDSGYRSPAYQVVTLLYYLKMYRFDLAQTAKRVAFPGYSEHGSPSRQAIDLMNLEGKPTDEAPFDFDTTEEFKWLIENAGKFGFVLSYPKDNKDGIMYEPWHWRYEG